MLTGSATSIRSRQMEWHMPRLWSRVRSSPRTSMGVWKQIHTDLQESLHSLVPRTQQSKTFFLFG